MSTMPDPVCNPSPPLSAAPPASPALTFDAFDAGSSICTSLAPVSLAAFGVPVEPASGVDVSDHQIRKTSKHTKH